ncbi:type II secretion system F family protein [Atopobium fossor]|uniref:type II secretion system F family protein n=1 Tax=Atopobium fossor TaxID=39487 RepID=UPI0004003D59|nr:type II secretion system F family protein [Atopobium fossor]
MEGSIFFILILAGVYIVVFLVLSKRLKHNRIADRLESIEQMDASMLSMPAETPKTFYQRVFKSYVDRIVKVFGNAIPLDAKSQEQLTTDLRSAGDQQSAREWLAQRILLALIMGATGWVFFKPLVGITFALAVYVLSRFILKARITERRNQIEMDMPGSLDLLSSCVTAGLGFDQALQHVVNRTNGPLSDEFKTTLREISLGGARRDALAHLSERCGVEPMRNFVTAVNQADKLGVPIANILVAQSVSIREYRASQVEERAAKMPVKMMLPLVVCLLPCLLIVLLAPAALNIIETLHL